MPDSHWRFIKTSMGADIFLTLTAVRRDMLLQRQAGPLGFNPRIIGRSCEAFILSLKTRSHPVLKLRDRAGKLLGCRFVVRHQPGFLFAGHL